MVSVSIENKGQKLRGVRNLIVNQNNEILIIQYSDGILFIGITYIHIHLDKSGLT